MLTLFCAGLYLILFSEQMGCKEYRTLTFTFLRKTRLDETPIQKLLNLRKRYIVDVVQG
jgi:hypothetical protein